MLEDDEWLVAEEANQPDRRLRPEQKSALVAVYRSYCDANETG